jgi:hypothetical protein
MNQLFSDFLIRWRLLIMEAEALDCMVYPSIEHQVTVENALPL